MTDDDTGKHLPRPAQAIVHAPSGLRLDSTDLEILRVLQEGAREPIKSIASRIALSLSGTFNRIHRLQEAGAIIRYVADIDESIFEGWPFYWVDIALTESGRLNVQALEALIVRDADIAEAVETVGEFDMSLKAALKNAADWRVIQRRLDPSAKWVSDIRLRPIGQVLKRKSPHPLLYSKDD